MGRRATYLTVTAEGSELLMLDPSGSSFRHSTCGVCVDCAPGAVCAWQECPNRNRLEEPASRSPLQVVEHEPVSVRVVEPVEAPLPAVEQPTQDRPEPDAQRPRLERPSATPVFTRKVPDWRGPSPRACGNRCSRGSGEILCEPQALFARSVAPFKRPRPSQDPVSNRPIF